MKCDEQKVFFVNSDETPISLLFLCVN